MRGPVTTTTRPLPPVGPAVCTYPGLSVVPIAPRHRALSLALHSSIFLYLFLAHKYLAREPPLSGEREREHTHALSIPQ